ncbi:hypothetical protein G6681_04995 [Polynucleobacter paneuropaeus]|nr:hypothetical protein G6681_04995 [Polynucleobacter paneuropaeus]
MSKISKYCVAAAILLPVLAFAGGGYGGGGNVKSAAVQNTVVTSASGGGTAAAGGLGIAYAGRTPIAGSIGAAQSDTSGCINSGCTAAAAVNTTTVSTNASGLHSLRGLYPAKIVSIGAVTNFAPIAPN